jgi:hypothetical protein
MLINLFHQTRRLITNPYTPLLILLLINLIVCLLTVRDYGASWDDPKRYIYATNALKAYLGQGVNLDDDKGPFYVMVARVGTEIIVKLCKGWQIMEAWHLMHFLSFQVGVISLYIICLRFANPTTSLGTTALFSTQPLLWGHAFINSKDTPFMAFFICSVAVGLGMVDFFTRDSRWTEPIIHLEVEAPEGLLTQFWFKHARPLLMVFLTSFTNPRIWFVGALWGMTTSIRVLGPAAGILVAIYFLSKAGAKGIPVLLACFVIAGGVTYLTWPGLWASPLVKFKANLLESSGYPWEGTILFEGASYAPQDLPPRYLPELMGLQLGETALIMFIIGLVVAIVKFTKRCLDRNLIVLFSLWLILPLVEAMIMRPPLYDNFRHFLFIIPPIFLFAGIGLEALLRKLQKYFYAILVIAGLLLPNIYWDIKLHPYQYTYYNNLIGGVGGAFHRFETDYWATSYRQATLFINQTAPPGSTIIVWGPANIVPFYKRQDLKVVNYDKWGKNLETLYAYAILSTRENKDQNLFPHSRVVFQVGREGAIFTVVKQISP